MKRKSLRFVAPLALLFAAGGMFFVPPAANAQSSNHCTNKCNQSYRFCVRNATNPGALNQCGKALQRCLDAC